MRLWLAAALASVATPLIAAPLSGVYGNVEMSPDTGDLGGMEIEIHADGPDPYAEFVLCEGWCNGAASVPITVVGDTLTFDYIEQYTDLAGQPTDSRLSRISGRMTAEGLVLEGAGDLAFDPVLLPPQQQRFGLDVADGEATQADLEEIP